ncbi:MAG: cyclic nucleotide-binding domain-containing protein [Spirochaetes bacterium]|jgi:CRP-like cAMP-binding protein|nr:cyclic nucleotide-binding domain-containing protein [Spirochaetota bacterium]
MKLIDIMPGVKTLETERFSVMFGCPPEIIKLLQIMNAPFPDYIVIPDVIYKYGVVQNSTEFPLYKFLFELNNCYKKKLGIVGDAENVENNVKLLSLSLLGPTQENYKEIGSSRFFAQLYKESRYLALKDADGNESTIEDFVCPRVFDANGKVDLDGLTIVHENDNVYSVNDIKIDINFYEPQRPPYTLRTNYTPNVPFKFGVDILGGGSGFTPNQPCSALLLNYNSEFMLIDSVPYLDHSLNARGISKQQVKAIFLSHIHDDHCNMYPLLESNDRVKFLGTKEIFWMAIQKLALQTNGNPGYFHSFFDFIELEPYEENEYYGMTIIPHYTVHSIPTIGAIFKMKDREIIKRLCFVGDNKSLVNIREMVNEGVVSEKKAKYLERLYSRRFNVLFPDGGMGILHGDPEDSSHSKSDSVVFMHLEKLPAEFDAAFSLAQVGKRYNLIESNQHMYHAFTVQTIQMLENAFPKISYDWIIAIMNDVRFVGYNIDDIILKQGEERKGAIYIILSGRCRVKKHDGKVLRDLAIKEVGDFIGEMAIVKNNNQRTASVVAETPVILCQFDEKLFYQFLEENNIVEVTKSMWSQRSELDTFLPFADFSDSLNEEIARASVRRKIEAGYVVITEGDDSTSFYIVVSGLFSVEISGKKINVLKKGDIFGEFGSISDLMRTATVTAVEESVVLEIPKDEIMRIIDSTPALNFFIHRLLKRRSDSIRWNHQT